MANSELGKMRKVIVIEIKVIELREKLKYENTLKELDLTTQEVGRKGVTLYKITGTHNAKLRRMS